jgi:hypothetical protein
MGAAVLIFTSCTNRQPGEYVVSKRIPILIQSGSPTTLDIHSLSGNGPNDVGLQCSGELWNLLTNGPHAITIQLVSSSGNDTQVYGINPGGTPAGLLYLVPSIHYLFEAVGQRHASAVVKISFPNAPPGVTQAEIVVSKTPADTGP